MDDPGVHDLTFVATDADGASTETIFAFDVTDNAVSEGLSPTGVTGLAVAALVASGLILGRRRRDRSGR